MNLLNSTCGILSIDFVGGRASAPLSYLPVPRFVSFAARRKPTQTSNAAAPISTATAAIVVRSPVNEANAVVIAVAIVYSPFFIPTTSFGRCMVGLPTSALVDNPSD